MASSLSPNQNQNQNQTRHRAQNRKGLRKVSTARAERTVSRADIAKTPAALLVELVRDNRVSVYQFRRMAMCAGARVTDFFDTQTGKPYETKADIMLQIAANGRAVTYAPRFVTQVSNWLGSAAVRASDVVHGLVAAGVVAAHVADKVRKTAAAPKANTNDESDSDTHTEDHTDLGADADAHPKSKPPQPRSQPKPAPYSVLPSSDGVIHHLTGQLPTVAAVLAASYIVLRGVLAGSYSRKHSRLVKLMSGEQTYHTDLPFQQVQRLSPLKAKRTYAHTDECLRASYDGRLHDVLANHTKVPDIRLALMGMRKPWFFGGRTLLNLHLIRRNGHIRETPAEIAFALLHEYQATEVFDAAISYSAAAVTNIFSGMKRALRLGNSAFGSSPKSAGGVLNGRSTRSRSQSRSRPQSRSTSRRASLTRQHQHPTRHHQTRRRSMC